MTLSLLFTGLARWRRRRILRDYALADDRWRQVLEHLPWITPLREEDHVRLREFATLFLYEKKIVGAGDYIVDELTRVAIAAQACMLVLHLDLDWYRGFRTIIVYPDEFVVHQEYLDDDGVVHAHRDIRTGEAWLAGPIVLAASEILRDGRDDGVNVVIHEFAHKLDMRNGAPNGFPPLHADMSRVEWTRAFSQAYEDFCRRVDDGEDTALDPYASEAPEEFFAVMCEAFFMTPEVLAAEYPAVYTQLSRFFRRDSTAASPQRESEI